MLSRGAPWKAFEGRPLEFLDAAAGLIMSAHGRQTRTDPHHPWLVGSTWQSVNEELRRWEKVGWIRIDCGGIEVVDREAPRRKMAGT
ncbi:MAG: helix-turn-helix domain-containing protein [Betaproteobacteria bacterium]